MSPRKPSVSPSPPPACAYATPAPSRSHSRSTSVSLASLASDTYEADDEANDVAMADDPPPPPKPLTVAIPRSQPAAVASRRPNLSEILANSAPPPWTLSAFMAYMSTNHCLETLEFTMDASRYRKHYSKMVGRNPGAPISPASDECAYVNMLWKRLLDAYIAPNGPREVNLPGDVRDPLLVLADAPLPPPPSTLDAAVAKIYELMEDSVLHPFLNSLYPQSAAPDPMQGVQETGHRTHTASYDGAAAALRQPMSAAPSSTQRASAPSNMASTYINRPFAHSRFSSVPSTSSSSRATPGYGSGSDALTDDSGSGSPSGVDDPMTPPSTPPLSDFATFRASDSGASTSGTPSPRVSRGEHSLTGATKDGWKRMSSKLWSRKRSGGALREDEQAFEGAMF